MHLSGSGLTRRTTMMAHLHPASTGIAPEMCKERARRIEPGLYILKRRERSLSPVLVPCTRKETHTPHPIPPGLRGCVCAIRVSVHMIGKMGVIGSGSSIRLMRAARLIAPGGCGPVRSGVRVQRGRRSSPASWTTGSSPASRPLWGAAPGAGRGGRSSGRLTGGHASARGVTGDWSGSGMRGRGWGDPPYRHVSSSQTPAHPAAIPVAPA